MRIRTIKPEFFLHDGLFEAELSTRPADGSAPPLPLRLAFVGLWCAADREGRFKWEPRRLGVSILPYDGVDFSRVLDALATRGFVVKYRVGDAWFGWIPTFTKHQIINNRETESKLPSVADALEKHPDIPGDDTLPLFPMETPAGSPPAPAPETSRVHDASSTRAERVTHAAVGEGKGKEGKGRERIVPPNPQGGIDASAKSSRKRKRGQSTHPDDHSEPVRRRMLAIGSLHRRMHSTRWSAEEFDAFHDAGLDTMGDADFEAQLAPLTRHYSANIPREKDFRRQDTLRLLRHWSGELDKARAWCRDNDDGVKRF